MTTTLHGCEADIYSAVGQPPYRCGAPAIHCTAPSGRAYFLCATHKGLLDTIDAHADVRRALADADLDWTSDPDWRDR